MYGKIFSSMYDGTLRVNWQALVTFQQLIVLCDSDGVIDMTPEAISGRTGIPLDIIREGIEKLEAPDPYSRTPDFEGRRLERLDEHRPWGWRIVNYLKYRSLVNTETVREQNRERQKRYRERNARVTDSNASVTQNNDESRQEEVEVDTDKTLPPISPRKRGVRKSELSEKQKTLFNRFWESYPKKRSKGQAERAWSNITQTPDEQLVATMVSTIARAKKSDGWQKDGGHWIPHPGTWLNAKGWLDDYGKPDLSSKDPPTQPAIIHQPEPTPAEREANRLRAKEAVKVLARRMSIQPSEQKVENEQR